MDVFPSLSSLKGIVPKHIRHQYSEEMGKPSEILGLPVVPFNQNKVGDVCQYLSSLTKFLVEVFDDPAAKPHQLPPNASADQEAGHASKV